MEKKIQLSLKKLRQRQGMTQKELAEKLQISFQTISKWENGITMPDIAYLPKLSAILDVSTDVLLGMKPLESEERWRRFDAYGYWNQHADRTKLWKRLYWNDDYFTFLVKEVWRLHDPVNILDFGCGYGFLGMVLLPLLPEESTYTGIDLDGSALEEARCFFKKSPWETRFIRQDIYEYKPETKYDIAIALQLMTYLQRPDEIVQKMKASLKEGGKLILMDTNMEVEQAGYYSCVEQEEGLERPDFTPIWKREDDHRERDYRMGTKLPALLKSIGMESVQARISDQVILYDPADEEKRELSEIFRYVHENKDSSLEGHSYYQSRGASYAEAALYVDYFQRTKQYFDSDDPFAVSTSALYFVWGELPEQKERQEENGDAE